MKSLKYFLLLCVGISSIPSSFCAGGTSIGSACTNDTQCTGTASICSIVGHCICPKNYVPRNTLRNCLPIREKIGDGCTESPQCQQGGLGRLSTCTSGKCACNSDSIAPPGEQICYKKVNQVGDTCDVNYQCTSTLGSQSQCSGGKCVCTSLAIPSNDKGTCLLIRNQIGNSCEENQQCTSGVPGQYSECRNSTCKCKSNALHPPGGHQCYPNVTSVGATCDIDYQCTTALGPLSKCENKKCTCTDEGVSSSNGRTCLPIRNEIGDNCLENQQCTTGVPGALSRCVESGNRSYCDCRDDAIHAPNDHYCYKRVENVGDLCEIDYQCTAALGNLSFCYRGRCSCTGAGVSSQDKTTCLPIRNEIGDECLEKQQCSNGIPGNHSDCVESEGEGRVCDCTDLSIHPPGGHHCYLKVNHVGDVCKIDYQCTAALGNLSLCSGGNCRCSNNGVPSQANSTCLPIRNQLGDQCLEPQQCTSGVPGALSDCVGVEDSKICNCILSAANPPNEHKCYLKAESVGDPCEKDVQCYINLGNLSLCGSEGKCVCNSSTAIPSGNGIRCLAIINEVGGACEEDAQCQTGVPGDWSVCESGECTCKNGSFPHPPIHICYKRAENVEESCLIPAQCKQGLGDLSDCSNGTCICGPGGVSNLNGTKCFESNVLIGHPCEEDHQCVGEENSECTLSGHCTCLSGLIQTSELDDCLPILNKLGDECQEDEQCQHGVPGEWSQCLEQNHPWEGKFCNCSSDAVSEAERHKCYEKAEVIGDKCEVQEQCTASLGYAHCWNEACQCFGSAQASQDKSRCIHQKELGESCGDDEECGQDGNAVCRQETEAAEEHVCVCEDGFSRNSSTCIRNPIEDTETPEVTDSTEPVEDSSTTEYPEVPEEDTEATENPVETTLLPEIPEEGTEPSEDSEEPDYSGEYEESSTDFTETTENPEEPGDGSGSTLVPGDSGEESEGTKNPENPGDATGSTTSSDGSAEESEGSENPGNPGDATGSTPSSGGPGEESEDTEAPGNESTLEPGVPGGDTEIPGDENTSTQSQEGPEGGTETTLSPGNPEGGNGGGSGGTTKVPINPGEGESTVDSGNPGNGTGSSLFPGNPESTASEGISTTLNPGDSSDQTESTKPPVPTEGPSTWGWSTPAWFTSTTWEWFTTDWWTTESSDAPVTSDSPETSPSTTPTSAPTQTTSTTTETPSTTTPTTIKTTQTTTTSTTTPTTTTQTSTTSTTTTPTPSTTTTRTTTTTQTPKTSTTTPTTTTQTPTTSTTTPTTTTQTPTTTTTRTTTTTPTTTSTSTAGPPSIPSCDDGRMFHPDPTSCGHYYQCANGIPYRMPCPGGLVFNPNIGNCDWPYNYKCQI